MIELLERLCTAKGVSGREESICRLIYDEMKQLSDTVSVDKNNNVIAQVGDIKKHNIMLDAHLDEIGFIVTYIDERGFLKVSSCGGMDMRVIPDTRFKVQTDNGEITAVSCCMPPHLSDGGEDKAPSADSIYLDTGLPAQKVKEIVSLGDIAAFDVSPAVLLNNRFSCCSADNRAGCAVLIRVAQLIKENPVKSGVTFAFTAQEETYGKGAVTAAYEINPDEAVCVDVSFAMQSGVSPSESGELDKGGMICISPVLSKAMNKKLTKLAKEKNIPYQYEVTGGVTGTNADKISVTRSGIPTAVISVPQRNMHTNAEIISVNDIENVSQLIYEYIRSCCKGE
ncbi:MAG: M20/M25/M40 family metallo-hydrolase [Clostridia bacterium]|nr:M20/M25/M40 family metallo-hydrolase [Clostridia bacterium]